MLSCQRLLSPSWGRRNKIRAVSSPCSPQPGTSPIPSGVGQDGAGTRLRAQHSRAIPSAAGLALKAVCPSASPGRWPELKEPWTLLPSPSGQAEMKAGVSGCLPSERGRAAGRSHAIEKHAWRYCPATGWATGGSLVKGHLPDHTGENLTLAAVSSSLSPARPTHLLAHRGFQSRDFCIPT